MARILRSCLAVCLVLLCASAEASAGAAAFANRGSRRQLFQARLGVVTDTKVQAPDATKWSAGAVTAASGPAAFKTTTKVVGPDVVPSAAFGVNPTGGYATVNTLNRVDLSQGLIPVPKVHVDAKASIANTGAADVALGTNRIIPTVQNSVYARPTVPLTFPVFAVGGKLLPEPTQSVRINPFAEPSSGDRRRLFQARLGVVTDTKVQAPDATKWSAGAVTAASGPAAFKTTTKVVGPDVVPSAAFGVNPTGGYATVNTLNRVDLSQGLIPVPKVHVDAKASIANTGAADVALGTNRIIPTVQNSVYARPTVPLTFPVFAVGGKLLPEPTQSVRINPFAEPSSGDRRRLANWGSEVKTTAQAPSAPSFKVTVNPTPARSNSNTVVRVERPSFAVKNEVPPNVVEAKSNTKVDVAPQPKWVIDDKSGKGSWVTVNLLRGPPTGTSTTEGAINWPTGSAVAQSNNPLYIQQGNEATLPNPSRYVNVDVKPNNLGALPDGFVQTTSSTTVPIGRRRLANWGSEVKTTAQAPSAPSFKVTVNPTPARSNSNTVVRVERPSFAVKNEVPANVVEAKSNTKVDVAPQPKWVIDDKSGKGSWVTVNLLRGPPTGTSTTEGAINWPTGSAVAQSNNPLYIQQGNEATLPNPSRYVNVDVKPNNLGALPDGFVQTTSSTTVPIGRK